MIQHLICGAVAFAAGALISLIDYGISKSILTKDPNKYAVGAVVRQILNVGLLLICFLIGENSGLSVIALLVGAVLGITLPSLLFTPLLLKINREKSANTDKGKEEVIDG